MKESVPVVPAAYFFCEENFSVEEEKEGDCSFAADKNKSFVYARSSGKNITWG